MEPLPETTEAVEEFGPFGQDDDLLDRLREKATSVQAVVPDCVGVSVTSVEHGVTFTLVATDQDAATLDALQYAQSGPCVAAAHTGQPLACDRGDLLDEERWQLFARGTAATGVASSLSLPILVDDRVVGSVNLYAASPRAFAGHHEQVADIFNAWAPGAVTNADLSFMSRSAAREAPGRLRDALRLEMAAGILAARLELDVEAAHRRLEDAAARAGVSVARLAETVIDLHQARDES